MLSHEMLANEVRGQGALQRIIAEAFYDPDPEQWAALQEVLNRMWGRPAPALASRRADGIDLSEIELSDRAGSVKGLATPAKRSRRRVQPLREAAKQAIAILYPKGIPSQLDLPNKQLCEEVCEYMIRHLQITTIELRADGNYRASDTVLRAAGRK